MGWHMAKSPGDTGWGPLQRAKGALLPDGGRWLGVTALCLGLGEQDAFGGHRITGGWFAAGTGSLPILQRLLLSLAGSLPETPEWWQ